MQPIKHESNFCILKMLEIFNGSSSNNKRLVWALKSEKEKISTQRLCNLLMQSKFSCFELDQTKKTQSR